MTKVWAFIVACEGDVEFYPFDTMEKAEAVRLQYMRDSLAYDGKSAPDDEDELFKAFESPYPTTRTERYSSLAFSPKSVPRMRLGPPLIGRRCPTPTSTGFFMSTEPHYLTLHKSKFYFYKAGSSGRLTLKYDAATLMHDNAIVVTEASQLAGIIASAMIETRIYDLGYSSSCDFPDEEGRPDFDRFELDEMITAILKQQDS